MEAILALEDGTWFRGAAAGATGEAGGEVVFNTSMTGYQEVLTDPSYAGQIVTMTCPEIGNYGVVDRGRRVARAAGGRLHHPRRVADGQQLARRRGTLRDYLVANNIVAISDIDTRALTRMLRSAGVMRGVIATGSSSIRRRSSSRRARFRRWKAPTWCAASRRPRRSTGREEDPDEFGVAPDRAAEAPAEDRRLRLRHEVEHPAPPERARLRRPRVSGDDAGVGAARDASRTASSSATAPAIRRR